MRASTFLCLCVFLACVSSQCGAETTPRKGLVFEREEQLNHVGRHLEMLEAPVEDDADVGGECAVPSDREGYECMIVPPGLEGKVRVHWVIGPVTDSELEIPGAGEGEISFLLEGNTTGWLGFSFAESAPAMFPADAVVGWVTGGTATIKSYRVTERSIADGDEDASVPLTGLQGTEEDGVTIIEYTRSLSSGTVPIDITAGFLRTNAALGGVDRLEWHGGDNRTPFSTDFIAGLAETV